MRESRKKEDRGEERYGGKVCSSEKEKPWSAVQ